MELVAIETRTVAAGFRARQHDNPKSRWEHFADYRFDYYHRDLMRWQYGVRYETRAA